jgi:Xaa-Pro aminopeptidase
MLVSALDDIAWTLNLRGSDVHCNPVFVAYLLISSLDVTLYVQPTKVTDVVKDYLAQQGVRVADYGGVGQGLKDYFEYNILIDPNETSYTLAKGIHTQEVIRLPSPIPALKAVKNEAEIAGFRQAMLRDGIALVQFLRWLKPAVEAGGQTELSIDRKLTALRAQQPLFRDISFDTIAGYGAHGAIVHYEAHPSRRALGASWPAAARQRCQYMTSHRHHPHHALGPLTEEERPFYTWCRWPYPHELCSYPEGARAPSTTSWPDRPLCARDSTTCMHGHGVGSYHNVHEGPHQTVWSMCPRRCCGPDRHRRAGSTCPAASACASRTRCW